VINANSCDHSLPVEHQVGVEDIALFIFLHYFFIYCELRNEITSIFLLRHLKPRSLYDRSNLKQSFVPHCSSLNNENQTNYTLNRFEMSYRKDGLRYFSPKTFYLFSPQRAKPRSSVIHFKVRLIYIHIQCIKHHRL
jgi:hypothetical protein